MFGSCSETFNPSKYMESIPDSLRYKTAHGRDVFGGGGILPDYIVKPDTTPVMRTLLGNGLDVRFVRHWFIEHEGELRDTWGDRQDAFTADFDISPEVWDEFWVYSAENGVKTTTVASKVDHSEGIFAREEVDEHRTEIETYIRARLAQELFGNRAWYTIYKEIDPEIRESMKMWDRATTLAAYSTSDGMR